MPLTPGTRLGSYQITGAIGAGGMGEVYRARDAKLDRDVAVKVLPAHLGVDPGARARFEREAKAVAGLSHPNILAVYDFGIEGQTAYVVMELLEGETLRERLSRGALPVRKALQIGRDVAQGLAAAHDKGIVHRDIKPENVFITASGVVKILDFGLARQTSAGSRGDSNAQTSIQATDPGTVMGTVGYMSPEQVSGQPAGAPSDLFSLGCVLFETVTGRRPFDRATPAETMTAILREDPANLTRTDGAISPAVDDLIRHCLEKQPEERFQSARDLAFALQSLSGGSSMSGQAAILPGMAARRSPRLAWSVTAAALLVAAGAAWWAVRAPAQELWTGVHLGGPMQAFGARLSPDGQLLAFLAFVEQQPQVAVMKPDAASWTVLTNDRSRGYVATVAWAPDSSRIYFDRMVGSPLGVYSVPPLGGEPRPLLDNAWGPEALPDGSLIVLKLTDQGDEQLFHFWPDSDRLEPLPAFMPETDVAPMLRAFPDGKALVFYGMTEANRSQAPRMLVYDLASRTSRDLGQGLRHTSSSLWSPVEVSPDGQSVYLLSDEGDMRFLLQVPRSAGKPRVLLSFANSAAPVAVSAARDGSLYLDQLLNPAAIIRASSSGGLPEEFNLPANNRQAAIVPDGEALLTEPAGGKQQLLAIRPGSEPRVLVNTSESTTTPATIFGDYVAFSIGMGDEQRIALATLRDGRVIRRYGSRSDEGLSASPDGKTLYYSVAGGVWAQPVDGGQPARITDGEDVVIDPAGQHLYVKRSQKGTLSIVRLSVRGTDDEELPIPPGFHVADPPLSAAAVDARGRLLVTVLSQSFYYKTAVFDPATKSFALLSIPVEGDVSSAGWTPDGRILASGERYLLSLWRYQRSTAPSSVK